MRREYKFDYARAKLNRFVLKEQMAEEPRHFPLDLEHAADRDQAVRMPVLHQFFMNRTVDQLLMDMHWLVQYLIFRQWQETHPDKK